MSAGWTSRPALAFAALTVTIALGVTLILWHALAAQGRFRPPRTVGYVHGALGLAGAVLLALSLAGGEGEAARASGVGHFRAIALAAVAAAIVLGCLAWISVRRRGSYTEMLFALHGVFAVFGYVMLLAFLLTA